MADFGKDFSKINKKINDDLYSVKDSKEKQIAIILRLIMDCHFRIGNERYSKKYKSYGTTTLENQHVKVFKNLAEVLSVVTNEFKNSKIIDISHCQADIYSIGATFFAIFKVTCFS